MDWICLRDYAVVNLVRYRSDNDLFSLVKVVDQVVVQVKVSLDQRGRRNSKPLAETDVLEAVCVGNDEREYEFAYLTQMLTGVENLQEAQGGVPNVLDIVAVCSRNIADIARLIVVGRGVATGGEKGDTSLALTMKQRY